MLGHHQLVSKSCRSSFAPAKVVAIVAWHWARRIAVWPCLDHLAQSSEESSTLTHSSVRYHDEHTWTAADKYSRWVWHLDQHFYPSRRRLAKLSHADLAKKAPQSACCSWTERETPWFFPYSCHFLSGSLADEALKSFENRFTESLCYCFHAWMS